MGLKWSQLPIFGRFFQRAEPELRIGMLGLDNAGKTTILYQLKLERSLQTVPTVGFNVETVRCGHILMNIWDVSGGQPKTRVLWQHYNKNTRAIIFVIDAGDVFRLPLVIEELQWLCRRPELTHAPFLVFANKQDLSHAFSAEKLVPLLGLQKLKQQWTLQECCALNGVGLWDGLHQLQDMLENVSGKDLICK